MCPCVCEKESLCQGVNCDDCTEHAFVPLPHAAGIKTEERKQGHGSLHYLFFCPSAATSALEPLLACLTMITLLNSKKASVFFRSDDACCSHSVSLFFENSMAVTNKKVVPAL